ncbi:MAG: diaminopimelate dehydrogenase [Bacteroidetes bacterium]|jgi:diaminopimelate dehydrogenase|nr:diaminopimelate dehydrogenase [Bacteroidota bacterium]
MSKIRIAIVGYGHVGECALQSVLDAPDMEAVGIVELPAVVQKMCQLEPMQPAVLSHLPIVDNIKKLSNVDVAVLCCPSRGVHRLATEMLEAGVNTVDSFDIHSEIPKLRRQLGEVARRVGKVSVLSAGWDPGIDSVVRGWLEAMAPKGITHTNYGPGMSMGHTCAAKAIEGVKDALSITVPMGMGVHRRMVYVEVADGAAFEDVEKRIKQDAYFAKDRTLVFQVSDVRTLLDVGHGVTIERIGVSGTTHNQNFKFMMRINNPALTAQVMVSAARAAMRHEPGCYTMIELPVIDFLAGDVETFVQQLV